MNSPLLLDALKGENSQRPPVWLMRQAGRYMSSYQALRRRYSFLEMCHQPDLITEISLLPIKELEVDAAILFSDILIPLEAMGFKLRFDENVGPIIENPLSSPSSIDSLISRIDLSQMNFLKTAISSLKGELNVPLLGFAGAPFTLASYLIEGKSSRELMVTKEWAYRYEAQVLKLLSILEDVIVHSLQLQAEAGCAALQIFDSWAHVLSANQFEKFTLNPLKRIVERLKPQNVPLIFFCRNSSYLAKSIAKTGVTAISVDWLRPIQHVRKELPFIPLQGNLDPAALHYPKSQIKEEVDLICNSMVNDRAFIFNLGHGILKNTNYENVKYLVDLIKNRQNC